ncbi:hypothetical protein ACQHIV_03865 [Kribbella sp. GL6]|uniref:hypothetical protein n=1 Tax=Kribbella sp. GL6 TaxID=3419765 RepID=UPI003CFC808D
MTGQYWRATVGRGIVTSPPGHSLGGYAARTEPSTGVADQLEVNVMVLREPGADPATGVGWIAIDALAITEPLRQSLLDILSPRLGLPPDRLLCLASHTHSAPTGWIGTIHPVLPAAVEPELLGQLESALQALEFTEHQVRLSVGEATIDGVGSNRHRPDGPHDNTTRVLRLDSIGDSGPVAVFYDFACHPTVLGPGNLSMSADWVGAARSALRTALGLPGLPVVFGQGCAGDVSPRFHRQGRDVTEVSRLGGLVASRLLHALQHTSDVTAGGLTLSRDRFRIAGRTDAAQPPMSAGPKTFPDRVAASFEEGRLARAAMLGTTLPDMVDLAVSTVRVGNIRWLHLPVELTTSLGADITATHPDTRIIGYTDDYRGYVADTDAHTAGHYEASSSFLDAAGSQQLVRLCQTQLAQPDERYTTST